MDPSKNDLDRVKADLGEAASDFSAEELDAVIEVMAWSETPQVDVPETLKARIFEQLSAPIQNDSKPIPIRKSPSQSSRTNSFLKWAMAAAVVFGSVFSFSHYSNFNEETIDALKAENQTLLATIESYKKNQGLAQLKIVSLQSELDAAYFGAAVWDGESERGILKVARVPQLEAGKDYQLWIVDPQYKTPVDGGVFQVDKSGEATIAFQPKRAIKNVTAFAVSLEKKGGVPVAEGPMVLVGAL